MKIEYSDKETKKVGALSCGDTFIFDGSFYILTDYTKDNVGVINLENGHFGWITYDCTVKPVSAKVVIE